MKNNIFVVVPSYNESKKIESVLVDLLKSKYKFVVVDDGSKDGTLDIVKKYTKNIVVHKVNLGKGAAMKTGAKIAFSMGADSVIFMDADGQHKVSELEQFSKKLNQGYDIVFGSRSLGFNVPLIRFLGNKIAAVVISLLFNIYVSDVLCGYRAISKKAFAKISWDSSKYGVETEMVVRTSKTKLRYCEIPVEAIYFDSVKGVTPIDAINILMDVVRWKFTL